MPLDDGSKLGVSRALFDIDDDDVLELGVSKVLSDIDEDDV